MNERRTSWRAQRQSSSPGAPGKARPPCGRCGHGRGTRRSAAMFAAERMPWTDRASCPTIPIRSGSPPLSLPNDAFAVRSRYRTAGGASTPSVSKCFSIRPWQTRSARAGIPIGRWSPPVSEIRIGRPCTALRGAIHLRDRRLAWSVSDWIAASATLQQWRCSDRGAAPAGFRRQGEGSNHAPRWRPNGCVATGLRPTAAMSALEEHERCTLWAKRSWQNAARMHARLGDGGRGRREVVERGRR